jgi:hypothetical protein
MSRYSAVKIITTQDNPKRRYVNCLYPEIKPDFQDIYVYTTVGDRYDLLALQYYGDSSIWWIISRANPNTPFDSLYPNVGEQIRIPSPSRISTILSQFDNLNQ